MTSAPHAAAPQAASRPSTEHTFASWDGTPLFYRAWLPANPRPGALLLFHRGHEHSGRWQETVDGLKLDDLPVFAWDARGHGHSPGERGWAAEPAGVVRDVDCFVRHISSQYGIPVEEMMVVATSVGSVHVSAWVHDYAPKIKSMVLAVPALKVRLYVPFARQLLRIKEALLGPGFVKSYVKGHMLTHDPAHAEAYHQDPLIFRQIAVNVLLDLYETGERIIADAGAITTPTMVMVAGADWVVSLDAQFEFYERLSSPIKRLEVLPGFYHAIFQEKERQLVWDKVRDFLLDPCIAPRKAAPLLDADRHGYTHDEYERLKAPGSFVYTLLSWAMRTLGRLSKGIRIGLESGFDSGVMLDHVYRNEAEGNTPLGQLIDRIFLDSIGWRGIRLRREHLEGMLARTLRTLHGAGMRLHVLDVAAGPGRYVLETMRNLAPLPVTATLRDYKQVNVDAGQQLATEMGLTGVKFEIGDAFDTDALAAHQPRPTVGIVSGLFELIPDNDRVLRSLRGLFQAIEPGGYIIYTNQPWHPQLELIARSLGNREGQPWVMRRRTQAEMDALVESCGFVKQEQELDRWGIFTVSIARRP